MIVPAGEGKDTCREVFFNSAPRHCAVAFWSWMTREESQSEE